MREWLHIGHAVPLIVDLQPAGANLGEDFYRAGGVPAVVNELMAHGLIHDGAHTVNGATIGENCPATPTADPVVIRGFADALLLGAGVSVRRWRR